MPGLRSRPIPGRPSYLSAEQKTHLAQVLLHGAQAAGYQTELWTLKRIAKVIWQEFRVRYRPNALWYLLRGMGWSCQKPQRRACQRDEAAIAHWTHYRWPHIKKGCAPGGACGFPGRKWLFAPPQPQTDLGSTRADPLLPRVVQTRTGQCFQRLGRVAEAQAPGPLRPVPSAHSPRGRSGGVSHPVAPTFAWPSGPALGSWPDSSPQVGPGLPALSSPCSSRILPRLCSRTQSGGVCVEPRG